MAKPRSLVNHRKLQVNWVDLVQFGEPRFGWPIDDAKAIALYQWLLREMPPSLRPLIEGTQFENNNGPGYYMHPRPFMATERSCRKPGSLEWRVDLRLRFAAMLLARRPPTALVRWRRRARVHVDLTTEVPVRHRDYDPAENAIAKLGALAGRRFKVSPNSVHRRAVYVYHALFHVDAERFRAILEYGYPSERRFGSSWDFAFESRPRELFTDFMERAVAEFEVLMLPAAGASAAPRALAGHLATCTTCELDTAGDVARACPEGERLVGEGA